MALYGANGDGNLTEMPTLYAANGEAMPAKTVFVAYLKALKEAALKSIREGQLPNAKIQDHEIRWVLCQPTIWYM